MEFAIILKEIMVELQLNQSELAKKIGVKQSQISEWIKGKSKPGYDNLKSMCINLNISANVLLGVEEE